VDEDSLSTALLLIRLALGLMLITHGSNKIFGSGGIDGTSQWFEALGLRPGHFHAWLAATTEIGGGALMCIGLLFPVPCAAFVGLMVVAALTDHRGKGFFVFKGGWEYAGVVAAIAAALGITGAGRWSLDYATGSQRHGLGWGSVALAVGVVAGVGTVMLFGAQNRAKAHDE
jgi:putative oxidoreductase